jgi:hypothetical protein
MKTSRYFDLRVRGTRPEVKIEYVERVLANPIEVQQQGNGFYKMWGFVEEEQQVLRVITWADRETVENAFFDRRYTERRTS